MLIRELTFWMEQEETAESRARLLPAGEAFGLFVNLGNSLSLCAQGARIELGQGCFTVLGPGEAYQIRPLLPALYLWLPLKQDFLNAGVLPPHGASSLAASRGSVFPMPEKIFSSVLELAKKLSRAYQAKDWSYYAFCHSWISEIFMNAFCCIVPPKPKASGETSAVWKIISYLEENYTEKISVDMLASRFYISKYHLMRQFKKETGCTIHSFIQSKRVGHACRLMRAGLSPSEACYRSGFTDYSLFFKAFTKTTGASPSRYLNARTG